MHSVSVCSVSLNSRGDLLQINEVYLLSKSTEAAYKFEELQSQAAAATVLHRNLSAWLQSCGFELLGHSGSAAR